MQSKPVKNLVILGSTGSIGTSTLKVVDALPDLFNVVGLSAHSQTDLLIEQARKYLPRWAVCTDRQQQNSLRQCDFPAETELLFDQDGLCQIAAANDVDIVVAAIVGRAGLESTWAALESGKTVALANKETLVMAGPLAMELARKRNARLLPVDSEHSAVFQAALAGRKAEIKRMILTASGGPFRQMPVEQLKHVTVDQALDHPTWNMGPKITVDSATMMNKSLEIIEARWLFDIEPAKIDVVIHPQSVVHSMVEFVDGSMLAQMSPPDMQLPIQYALTYPDRCAGPSPTLDLTRRFQLDFEPPDPERFPALSLGTQVAATGGTAGAVLNATNEMAVQAFLDRKLAFTEIVPACRRILDNHNFDPHPTLDEVIRQDRRARKEFAKCL